MSTYIRQAQQLMKDAGYYSVLIDGEFGKGSLKAVKTMLTELGHAPKPTVIQNELAWVAEARKHIGLKEIKGSKHNPTIMSWIANLGGWFKDDETPWCGTFVAECLRASGRTYPKHWYRALAYASYGTKLPKAAYGCLGVMSRTGGGHVTFIVGETEDGRYLVGLGGNQSDAVNLMKFDKSRFTAFVWAERGDGTKSVPHANRYVLPKYSNNLKVSTKED